MAAIVRVPGITIAFADGALVVPPLSLGSVELLQERIAAFTGDIASISIVIDSLHHALLRNYPDMTRQQVGELVDMGNMNDVMEAVMNVAGLRARAASAGGAKAAS